MQVEFMKVVQVATPVLIAGLGWALKMVLDEVRHVRGEVSNVRDDLNDLVSKELCEAHRLTMDEKMHRLEEMFKKHKV